MKNPQKIRMKNQIITQLMIQTMRNLQLKIPIKKQSNRESFNNKNLLLIFDLFNFFVKDLIL